MRSIALGMVFVLMMAGAAFCMTPQTYVEDQSYISYIVVPQVHNVRTTTTISKQVSVSTLPPIKGPSMIPYQQYAPPVAYPPVAPPPRIQYRYPVPAPNPQYNPRPYYQKPITSYGYYGYREQPCIFDEILMLPLNFLNAVFSPDYRYNYYN